MDVFERIPPHNKDAEICVLGAAMIEKDLFLDIAEIVTADDFYEQAHKLIFIAMHKLAELNKPIDIITVCEELSIERKLELAGGRSYIVSLSAAVPTTANALEYAKIVHEKAIYRKLISISADISEKSYKEEDNCTLLLDQAEEQILSVSLDNRETDYSYLPDILEQNLKGIQNAAEKDDGITGLSTGLISIDKMTNGLKKSNLIIVAARPSVGKTAFALNIAQNAALKKGAKVVIFSLEQDRLELGQRLLAMQARVDSKNIQTGRLSNEEWEDINQAVQELMKAEIIIDDTAKTAMSIRNKCRKFAADGKIDLVVIDYLQLMNQDHYIENRANAVASDSKYLKQLAKELKVPIIALAQLNKESTKRDGSKKGSRRPMMSEIKDSDAVAADADVIMLLHREDYYKDDPNEPNTNTCEVIIAKNRNGETGSVILTWLPKYTKFVDKAPEAVFK